MSHEIHPFSQELMAAVAAPPESGRRSPRQAEFIWVDRELMPTDRAVARLLNQASRFGPGVTAWVRAYGTPNGPAVFQLRPHLDRFLAAAEAVEVGDPAQSAAFLRDVVWRVIRANDFYQCHVRLALYQEAPLQAAAGTGRPLLAVTAWESFPARERKSQRAGLKLTVSPLARTASGSAADREAFGRWQNETMLAHALADQTGFDDALLLDEQGRVSDCGGDALVLVRGKSLVAAPPSPAVEAITVEAVAVLAQRAGLEVVREPFTLADLLAADEVFLCGVARELTAVRQVGEQLVGQEKPGPVTRRLQAAYVDYVHGRHPAGRRWLDYMDRPSDPLY